MLPQFLENRGGASTTDAWKDREGDGGLEIHGALFGDRATGWTPEKVQGPSATAKQAARPLCPYYRPRLSPHANVVLTRAVQLLPNAVSFPAVLDALRRVACGTCIAGIVGHKSMRRQLLTCGIAVLLFVPAALANERSDAKTQVEFGIKVAQNGLWNEALYRWQKAVQLDPSYAAAWNNLAIAFEHEGRFEEANQAYEKALQLDPKNLLIRQNYDLFKEINDRTKRRRAR
jgi:tetratricopeptide (TPR) repeat protein